MAETGRQYETIDEAAFRHRCCTKTIRRRISEGKLTAYRFGPHLLRLDPDEVDALLRPIPTVGTLMPSPPGAAARRAAGLRDDAVGGPPRPGTKTAPEAA